MFSEVFPEIKLNFDEGSKQLQCEKNGNTYSPADLSDGERQAFFVLADLLLTTAPDSLIIVDEPELNLNALLSDRLWNTIEDGLPNALCVYGTRSIGFAMRQNVDTVVALSRTGDRAAKEEAKAANYVGAAATAKIFDEEIDRCRKALLAKDIDKVLRFVPGKELLAQLAPRIGCKDAAAVARAAYKHVGIGEIAPLRDLQAGLSESLAF
jgi:hypothetical protein